MTVVDADLLTRVLVASDALWWPFRWSGTNSMYAAAAIEERRAAFHEHGVPIVGGGDDASRKAFERRLQDAADGGYLRICRGGKRSGVRLTDHGDDVARKLTAGYTARESFPLIARVMGIEKALGDSNAGCTWEGEIIHPPAKDDFNDRDRQRIGTLMARALPLLARGWLHSASDTTGVVGYHVTDAGAAAKRPKCGELPDYDNACGDEYDRLFEAALADREAWQPRVRTLVVIPLGAGSWPERLRQRKRA